MIFSRGLTKMQSLDWVKKMQMESPEIWVWPSPPARLGRSRDPRTSWLFRIYWDCSELKYDPTLKKRIESRQSTVRSRWWGACHTVCNAHCTHCAYSCGRRCVRNFCLSFPFCWLEHSLMKSLCLFMWARAGPQTEKWENLNGTKFFCCL